MDSRPTDSRIKKKLTSAGGLQLSSIFAELAIESEYVQQRLDLHRKGAGRAD
jgi:hypothetical protein